MARILLIEDKKGVRRALAAALQAAGHEILEADDGRSGIELLKQRNFDLVITEVLLADLDGTEVLTWLEQQPQRPPVIAMSGGNSQIPAEMALLMAKVQASATLTKPIDEAELVALVSQLLSRTTAA